MNISRIFHEYCVPALFLRDFFGLGCAAPEPRRPLRSGAPLDPTTLLEFDSNDAPLMSAPALMMSLLPWSINSDFSRRWPVCVTSLPPPSLNDLMTSLPPSISAFSRRWAVKATSLPPLTSLTPPPSLPPPALLPKSYPKASIHYCNNRGGVLSTSSSSPPPTMEPMHIYIYACIVSSIQCCQE
jgi:hypothetical protein